MRASIVLVALALAAHGGFSADDLQTGFLNPPQEAKPQTWYHLMNGNVTKAGITRDFEARRLGLEITVPNCSGWSSSGGPWGRAGRTALLVPHEQIIAYLLRKKFCAIDATSPCALVRFSV